MSHRLALSALLLAACTESNSTGTVAQAAHSSHADLSTPADMARTFGNPADPGVFSCWTLTACLQTCSAPQYCCFNNSNFYGIAGEEGTCSNTPCVQSGSAIGSENCDGPEDCPSGQLCCAVEVFDPDFGIITNTIACQVGPCSANAYELCHPNGAPCSNPAQSCIIANAPSSSTNGCPAGQGAPTVADPDMPFNLHVCH
jgi:hypothetical protein